MPVDSEDMPRTLTVALQNWGPVDQPDLTVIVNGSTLYSGPVRKGRWSKTMSLDSVAPSNKLKIELLSDTQRKIDVVPGSLDKRELGVRLAGVILH